MRYTAYTSEEWENLPKKYKEQVLGVKHNNEIIQPPLCPECGGEMMEIEGYLSCIDCGCCRSLRVIEGVLCK